MDAYSSTLRVSKAFSLLLRMASILLRSEAPQDIDSRNKKERMGNESLLFIFYQLTLAGGFDFRKELGSLFVIVRLRVFLDNPQ